MKATLAVAGSLLLLAGTSFTPVAAAEEDEATEHRARFTFEAGPSFDHSNTPPGSPDGYAYFDARNGPNGYALAVAFEPNRRMLGPLTAALTLGFESYPSLGPTRFVTDWEGTPYLTQPGIAGKTAVTLTEDLRILFGHFYHVEPYMDLGVGWMWLHGKPREDLDSETGQLVSQYPATKFSGLMFEAAAGVRTYRDSGCDWMVGVRARGYTDILNQAKAYLTWESDEGGNNVSSGSTVQVYVGIVTPR